jgi:hypothetical protein
MKQSAIIYLATLMILFPLDFIFLRTGRRLFGANACDLILDDLTPAILFYVIYVACTVSFVNGPTPNDWVANASRGAPPTVDLAHVYFGLSRHADVQFRFINVNLVEATNRFSHFQSIAMSAGTPAFDEVPWRTVPPIPKENVMRGRMMMVLASAALAGSLLATDAQALGGGGHGGDGGGDDGFRGNHVSSGFGAPGDGYGSYDNRGNGLRGGYRGYGGRDVWGHWGAYYGPMVPTI